MASIATKLANNLRLLSSFNNTIITKNAQRNIFAASAFNIENFKKSQNYSESRTTKIDRDSLKNRLINGVKDENGKISSDDLRKFIYLIRTDEEVDLFANALAKYQNSDIGVVRFSYSTELMKYFYTTDKVDKAVEIFKNEKLKSAFTSPSALLILLNKLCEERRYAEVTKIFDYYLSASPRNFILVTTDVLRVVSEALYFQRNAEAVAKSKEYMKLFREDPQKLVITIKLAHFLVAFDNKDYEYAYELSKTFTRTSAIEMNIKAIGLAGVNRFSESFEKIENILRIEPGIIESTGFRRDTYVYPSTLKYIRARLEETKNEAELKKFEELSERVLKNKRLKFSDLNDIIERVLLNRTIPNQQNQQTNQPGRFDNRNIQQNDNFRRPNFQNRGQYDEQENTQQRRNFGEQRGRDFGEQRGRDFGEQRGRDFGEQRGRDFGEQDGRNFGQQGRNDDRRPFRSQTTSSGFSESQQGQQRSFDRNATSKPTIIPPPPSTSS